MSDARIPVHSTEIPPELDRWNWGAFLLNWIWGIGNNTFVALLTLVPGIGFIMMFVLGAKGSRWAWRNGRWDSIEHFRRVQRNGRYGASSSGWQRSSCSAACSAAFSMCSRIPMPTGSGQPKFRPALKRLNCWASRSRPAYRQARSRSQVTPDRLPCVFRRAARRRRAGFVDGGEESWRVDAADTHARSRRTRRRHRPAQGFKGGISSAATARSGVIS